MARTRTSSTIAALILASSVAACAPSAALLPAAPIAVSAPAEEPLPVLAVAPAEIAPVAVPQESTPPEEPSIRLVSAPAEPSIPRERVRAVVLVYHMVGAMETEMAVEPAAFEEQMAWLVDHHIPVVSTSALAGFLEGARALPERVAVLHFDDGHVSVRARAFPVLARHHLPFTVALNTEAIEGKRREAMTWDAVRELVASGLCEIGSHSHIHGHMERLTDARNRSEAEVSRSIIEARTGVRPEAFVYPFGGNDERVRGTIEDAGYRLAFAANGATARAGSPRFEVPRVGVLRSTTITAFARLFGADPHVAKAKGRSAHAG